MLFLDYCVFCICFGSQRSMILLSGGHRWGTRAKDISRTFVRSYFEGLWKAWVSAPEVSLYRKIDPGSVVPTILRRWRRLRYQWELIVWCLWFPSVHGASACKYKIKNNLQIPNEWYRRNKTELSAQHMYLYPCIYKDRREIVMIPGHQKDPQCGNTTVTHEAKARRPRIQPSVLFWKFSKLFFYLLIHSVTRSYWTQVIHTPGTIQTEWS